MARVTVNRLILTLLLTSFDVVDVTRLLLAYDAVRFLIDCL
jgi:hypothetical protein